MRLSAGIEKVSCKLSIILRASGRLRAKIS
jgi:hypothetical protein